ncbi:hypothetical protein GH733_016696 [Mirounga leonina]|nr:hypothetical protein GH733_016696 [Mirounga leonina]
MCQRSFQGQKNLEENEASHLETSIWAPGSLCSQFQGRLPLKSSQLQLLGRSPLEMLGSPSARASRLWHAPENPGVLLKWNQVAGDNPGGGGEGHRRAIAPISQPEPEEHSPVWSCPCPCPLNPGPLDEGVSRISVQTDPCAYPLQPPSKKETAFQSPYSLTEPLCSPSESDNDLEPVGAGIQHL